MLCSLHSTSALALPTCLANKLIFNLLFLSCEHPHLNLNDDDWLFFNFLAWTCSLNTYRYCWFACTGSSCSVVALAYLRVHCCCCSLSNPVLVSPEVWIGDRSRTLSSFCSLLKTTDYFLVCNKKSTLKNFPGCCVTEWNKIDYNNMKRLITRHS